MVGGKGAAQVSQILFTGLSRQFGFYANQIALHLPHIGGDCA